MDTEQGLTEQGLTEQTEMAGVDEAIQAMATAPAETPAASGVPPADDWLKDYESLRYTTFNVAGKSIRLDTYKIASELANLCEPFSDEDNQFLEAVAEWCKTTFAVDEISWSQASRVYNIVISRSTRLKKTVRISLDSQDFTV